VEAAPGRTAELSLPASCIITVIADVDSDGTKEQREAGDDQHAASEWNGAYDFGAFSTSSGVSLTNYNPGHAESGLI
jgi:hypothetical protein